MNFTPPYRKNPERIGRLNRKVTLYTPLSTRTSAGGEKIIWVEWRTPFAAVLPSEAGSSEATIADRRTAQNQKNFMVRYLSVSGINEKMIVEYNDEQYDINYLDEVPDTPNRQFLQIKAIRRSDNIVPSELIDGIAMGFSEKFNNVSGLRIEVTEGTLISPETHTISEIIQLTDLWASGYHLNYGSTAADGWSIDEETNEIVLVQALMGENVVYRQLQKLT